MAQWTQDAVSKTLNEVTRKSAVDPQFRKLCLTDARKAISQVSDVPIPEGFRVRFVENEGFNMTIVLPDLALAEGELSDSDLEQVAGGKGGGAPVLDAATASSQHLGLYDMIDPISRLK